MSKSPRKKGKDSVRISETAKKSSCSGNGRPKSASLLKKALNKKNSDNNFFALSVEVKDISLTDYIQVRHAVYLPHTAGRYAKKQFKKAQMPIVERLVDSCVALAFLGFS
jgi:hypothetical protein